MDNDKMNLKNVVILDLETYDDMMDKIRKLRKVENAFKRVNDKGKQVDVFDLDYCWGKYSFKLDLDELCQALDIERERVIDD